LLNFALDVVKLLDDTAPEIAKGTVAAAVALEARAALLLVRNASLDELPMASSVSLLCVVLSEFRWP